jgi:CRISPR/Cas system-associated endonuclease Cas1
MTERPVARRIEADPEDIERGMAQLVLTLVELIRQLMERQALRRLDAGSLTSQQERDLSRAFMLLAQKMQELKDHFGLRDEDLNLHLGPLGDLL